MRPTRRTLVRWQPGSGSFEVEPGARLLDAIDSLIGRPDIWLPTACRAANCGTCRVRVVDGAAALIPADPWEESVLIQHGAAPDERLGCQLCFKPDTDQTTEVIILERIP